MAARAGSDGPERTFWWHPKGLALLAAHHDSLRMLMQMRDGLQRRLQRASAEWAPCRSKAHLVAARDPIWWGSMRESIRACVRIFAAPVRGVHVHLQRQPRSRFLDNQNPPSRSSCVPQKSAERRSAARRCCPSVLAASATHQASTARARRDKLQVLDVDISCGMSVPSLLRTPKRMAEIRRVEALTCGPLLWPYTAYQYGETHYT